MKRLLNMLVALAVLCLSSCVMQSHQRALDMAKEFDGIVELHNAVYQVGNRFYVQGVQTTLRRSERVLIHCPALQDIGTKPERTGVYTILPDAPRKTVYREFRMRYGQKPFAPVDYAYYPMGCYCRRPPDDDAPVWPKGSFYERAGWHPYHNKKGEVIAWYKYGLEDAHSRDYKGKWLDKLPAGARPVLLTAEQIAEHPVLKGDKGVSRSNVWNRSEARVDTTRALFAYPLAGVLWVVPDAAATVAMHVPFIPLFIWIGIDEMF